MAAKFARILYGGDYNPGQWPEEIWHEDMRLFKKAHINSATINVFSWAHLQPAEDTYDFSQLDKIVDMLSAEGYDIVMGTSTAALPAWMVKKYPEVMYTDYEGRQHVFGQRHNACPNSRVFRKFAGELVSRLAQRYSACKHITCWHMSNEYNALCWCDKCQSAFRDWLKKRYKTVSAVNQAWNAEFWGHTFYDWDEIVVPNALSEGIGMEGSAFSGMSIDYRRFMSESLLDCYKMERDIIRSFCPEAVITTNLMGTYKGLDYFQWAKEMDIVSFDNYPAYNTPWSLVAMTEDLMRGLKDEPFMLMEQTPSQQNWQKYNPLKRPGQIRAQSYQTLAHGADTIQFFQLRRSIGGYEKFHGAVISHAGTENTRVFRELTQLGRELESLGGSLSGASRHADVGIIFDWDNYWALEYASGPSKELTYVDQVHRFYEFFYKRNIPVDMIPFDADLSRYKMIAAPVLYMVKPGMRAALEEFVKNGGTFVTTYMSGLVNETDNVYLGGYPGPLRELAGVWVEETDMLTPGQKNAAEFADGTVEACELLCDLMHSEGAEPLAVYKQDFYAGMPAAVKNSFGQGSVYYIGSQFSESGLAKILQQASENASVSPIIPEHTELEVSVRDAPGTRFYFIINFSDGPQMLPQSLSGKFDLLTGTAVSQEHVLEKWDVLVLAENI